MYQNLIWVYTWYEADFYLEIVPKNRLMKSSGLDQKFIVKEEIQSIDLAGK